MRRAPSRAVLAAALLLLLTACGPGGGAVGGPEPPRDGRAGVQLSGTFAGRQVAASDGSPDLLIERCAQRIGLDAPVCFAARDIDGTPLTIALLNPDVLEPGTTVSVTGECRSPEECGAVTGAAVIDVQVGDRRQRAQSGTLTVRDVRPGSYYSGALVLRFRDGRLNGGFDVVPRPEE
jgi:hypothetical protein